MPRQTKLLAILLLALSTMAISLSLYLTLTSWQSETVAGCGGDGVADCDVVLSSQWSLWLGLPVSLFGSITYLLILSIAWPAAKKPDGRLGAALLALALLAAGAAVWFIAIQAVLLQSFCFYCLGVHVCGLCIAGITLLLIRGSGTREADYDQMRNLLGVSETVVDSGPSEPVDMNTQWYPLFAMGTAAVGLALLMGGQLLFVPEGMVVETVATNDFDKMEDSEEGIANDDVKDEATNEEAGDDTGIEDVEDQVFESISLDGLDGVGEVEAGTVGVGNNLDVLLGNESGADISDGSQQLYFEGLQKSIDLKTYPMIGDQEAENIVVEMLDYTCDHCRHMHHYIEATLTEKSDQIAFVIHHVPLNSKCNRHVKKDRPEKRDACDYARLAIGVWRLAPEEFREFHSWLMESEKPPSILDARKRALDIAGEEVLIDESLKAEIGQQIAEQCDAAKRLKTGLPVLLTEQDVIKGVPRNQNQWNSFLEQRLGLSSTGR